MISSGSIHFGFFFLPSAEQLRAKRAERWWAVRQQGIASFCRRDGLFAGEAGQNNCSPGSDRFAGQRPRAQRSISADLIYSPAIILSVFIISLCSVFGSFLSRKKNKPSRGE